MNRKMTDVVLQTIVNRLKKYNPNKIILYGSLVRDQFTENSDIDLLIIKKTAKSPQKRMNEVLNILYPKDWNKKEEEIPPIDPLVYTPNEVNRELHLGDFFLEEIINQGKVLYEQT
jgi:predicted nucleotidyltransferase